MIENSAFMKTSYQGIYCKAFDVKGSYYRENIIAYGSNDGIIVIPTKCIDAYIDEDESMEDMLFKEYTDACHKGIVGFLKPIEIRGHGIYEPINVWYPVEKTFNIDVEDLEDIALNFYETVSVNR